MTTKKQRQSHLLDISNRLDLELVINLVPHHVRSLSLNGVRWSTSIHTSTNVTWRELQASRQ